MNLNNDIIYEILCHLYLEGHAPTARKILMSMKFSANFLRTIDNLEKPVVFEIEGYEVQLQIITAVKNVSVYWGDGCIRKKLSEADGKPPEIIHEYVEEKCYKIKIFGEYSGVIMPSNLVYLYSIGDITDMSLMFSKCNNFDKPLILDTQNVTALFGTFIDCKKFNQRLKWNTKKITDLGYTFSNCSSFNQELNWNTKNIINLACTFDRCISFNQSLNWNIENVTTLYETFNECISFNQYLPWNTENVTDMTRTFYNCKNFKQELY